MANYDLSKLDNPIAASPSRAIPPPDPRRFEYPFVIVPKIHNFRSLQPFSLPSNGRLRTNLIFRSAEPSQVTPEGEATIRSLGIKTIFDLRASDELENNKTRAPVVDIPGTQRVHSPTVTLQLTREEHNAHLLNYTLEGTKGYEEAYNDILRLGARAIRTIFTHIRDRPDDGILLHCTAGKDRTGIIVALALLLAGVSDEDIAEEYALTVPGLSEWVPTAFKVLIQEPVFAGDEEKVWRLGAAKKENMLAVLGMVRERWGGAEGYLKKQCGFEDKDLEQIREVLREKE